MNKTCTNRYKTCRVSAYLRQETAAALLGVSVRRLSDYETGRAKVPDDVAHAMAKLYRAPSLAAGHIRESGVFGSMLPDVPIPKTPGEMAFALVMAEDSLGPAVRTVKAAVAERPADMRGRTDFRAAMKTISYVAASLMLIAIGEGADD